MTSVSKHYDLLIENGNDPLLDGKELREYMDKWDGKAFIDELCLSDNKDILEIGCGTGRLFQKLGGRFKSYIGIDLSIKTVNKARERFNGINTTFVHGNFISHEFSERFDLIFSSLTFMHIKSKRKAIIKVRELLKSNGKFVLSIDKSQNTVIDTGYSKIRIYPDSLSTIQNLLISSGFKSITVNETELAFIISAVKE